jgi:hypothetical protein
MRDYIVRTGKIKPPPYGGGCNASIHRNRIEPMLFQTPHLVGPVRGSGTERLSERDAPLILTNDTHQTLLSEKEPLFAHYNNTC